MQFGSFIPTERNMSLLAYPDILAIADKSHVILFAKNAEKRVSLDIEHIACFQTGLPGKAPP